MLDLDEVNSETDVREYVVARLGSGAPQSTVDELAKLPFLTAWMITDQVLADGGGDLRFSLEAAFDRELAKVPSARALLTALTWSYGAGFPEAEWMAVAQALSGEQFSRYDITAVLTELGRHIVQDGEEGTAVFKLTHQTFADHLRQPFAPSRDVVFAPDAAKVACALIRLYRQRIEAGVPPNVPGYLWKYAWRHCGHAGTRALDGLRELAVDEPEAVAGHRTRGDDGGERADALGSWRRGHRAARRGRRALPRAGADVADVPGGLGFRAEQARPAVP